MDPNPTLCRDCLALGDTPGRCPSCRSPRTLSHPELRTLSIAHLDCDAFYASVEKRDDPSLRDRPVIVGGGKRGVVSTACYIARIKGVKSAMPMFKALALCPEAVVVRPRMSVYAEVSRTIRSFMLELTPLVEPLSLDEAFLDLTGTERLHRAPPAALLARLQRRIETELGITASIGLSHNKFLAKIASDQDKPRGFHIIGRAETQAFLDLPRLDNLGRRPGHARRAPRRRHPHRRRPPHPRPQAPDPPLRQPRRPPPPPLARPRHPPRRPRPGPEVDLPRDHLRRGHRRPGPPPLAPLVPLRAGLRPRQVPRPRRRRRHPEAETRRLRPAHPPPDPRRPTQMADRLYRTALPMLRRDIAAGPFRLIGVGLATLSAARAPIRSPTSLSPPPPAAWPPSRQPTKSAPVSATTRSSWAAPCAETWQHGGSAVVF